MQALSNGDAAVGTQSLRDALADQWVVPVLRYQAQEVYETAVALHAGGLHLVEITMSTEGVFEVARALVEQGVTVGIGTITDPASVHRAAEVGASFAVSFCNPPGFLRAAMDTGLLAVPGALTPSECFAAQSGGARYVKIFSARIGGPEYIRDLVPVLPGLQFVASGGISTDEAALRPWFHAGAALVAVGRELGTAGTVGTAEVTRRAVGLGGVRDALRAGGSPAR
ncbi:bifunctional 4-hydroxy-2-oxoglutarate aldolase/2-dehydro-3-deoxy-phosphogluconate aldolase [Nakamurella endophytica]|uniref:2-keto-3-deoxy-phosphogluconate aldolase n=1 Tax=Nakamurella endophytica TaxID=1748367 RepID=A0A917SVD7_9ACTN|nr:bifunctional 4-hydroxy-2-oxoglutarate aldolase/2-dehydro-3-deoxy-phosphogluconate aldolase [Nakamurella endophytica]GGL99496.1 2-keto-3-deoxy-phosphogluconate aldolase [Nakamurella endophytica]